jgi:hypothetical protein
MVKIRVTLKDSDASLDADYENEEVFNLIFQKRD